MKGRLYLYKGKVYKARSKDEVLRRLNIPVYADRLREVIKVDGGLTN